VNRTVFLISFSAVHCQYIEELVIFYVDFISFYIIESVFFFLKSFFGGMFRIF
jgi:hypothetical protein